MISKENSKYYIIPRWIVFFLLFVGCPFILNANEDTYFFEQNIEIHSNIFFQSDSPSIFKRISEKYIYACGSFSGQSLLSPNTCTPLSIKDLGVIQNPRNLLVSNNVKFSDGKIREPISWTNVKFKFELPNIQVNSGGRNPALVRLAKLDKKSGMFVEFYSRKLRVKKNHKSLEWNVSDKEEKEILKKAGNIFPEDELLVAFSLCKSTKAEVCASLYDWEGYFSNHRFRIKEISRLAKLSFPTIRVKYYHYFPDACDNRSQFFNGPLFLSEELKKRLKIESALLAFFADGFPGRAFEQGPDKKGEAKDFIKVEKMVPVYDVSSLQRALVQFPGNLAFRRGGLGLFFCPKDEENEACVRRLILAEIFLPRGADSFFFERSDHYHRWCSRKGVTARAPWTD